MALTNKPLWTEGLFIRPQHLQQQNRYLESLIERRAGLGVAPWGLRAMRLDREMLRLGRVGLQSCEVIMPDGTVLSVPEDILPPPARAIPLEARGRTVKLAVPARRGDAPEVHDPAQPSRVARLDMVEHEVADSASPARRAATLKLGVLRAQLILDGEPEDDLVTLPIAQVEQVDGAGAVTLSPGFIAPVLDCAAAPRLGEIMRDVEGLLRNLGDTLSARVDPSRATTGMTGLVDYLLLSVINRFEPLFSNFGRLPGLHPAQLHQSMLELAGELSTFGAKQRRPPAFPPYRHGDLESTFTPVLAAIRSGLTVVADDRVVAIPLQARDYGIWLGPIADKGLLRNSRFVLAAKSAMPPEVMRTSFPMQVKLGSVEVIRDLVNLQLPGIAIAPMPVAPRELPYYGGFTYFELSQSSELWGRMQNSSALAIHVSSEFTELTMELWAIRGASS